MLTNECQWIEHRTEKSFEEGPNLHLALVRAPKPVVINRLGEAHLLIIIFVYYHNYADLREVGVVGGWGGGGRNPFLKIGTWSIFISCKITIIGNGPHSPLLIPGNTDLEKIWIHAFTKYVCLIPRSRKKICRAE